MLTVYDGKGRSYKLTEQIGRGGEGTVFACPDDFSLVAKIYHARVCDEKAEKLRWMAENQDERLLKVAAWVVDVLTDSDGETVGFLMPNVKAKEIHELYSLKSRRVYFPEATWTFLVHTAANVARAFYVLHKNEHIMGDVNHGNCVVLADGTVKLIDCDSYSIKREGRRDACEVGVGTHLAPELQGKDLGRIERLPAHDNFGLAVIIFQLLFLGRHPFAGKYLGEEEKSLEDCIRELRFAYSADAHLWNVKQPPGTLSLSQMSPRVAVMFERAFLTEDRPQPREWIEALEDLSNSLAQCSLHIGHYYWRDLDSCPWCEIESQTGLMLFPFVSHNPSNKEENFNIFTVENLLASLSVPPSLPAKPQKSRVAVQPSEEARKLQRRKRRHWITFSAGQFIFILFVMAIFGSGAAFFLGIILMTAFLVISGDEGKNLKTELEERLAGAKEEWKKLENEWKSSDTAGFNDDSARVRQKIADYQNLQKQSLKRMKSLREKDFRYQLDLFLSAFKLSEAKIPDVSENELEELENFGFRTAADVRIKRLNSFSAIDASTRSKILEWRKNLENGFQFTPQAEIPEADLKRLENEFAEKRRRIEKEIENLLGICRARSTFLRQREQQLKERSEKLAEDLLQTEADTSAIGGLAPLAATLLLMTALLPIFGFALREPKADSRLNYSYSSRPETRAVPMQSKVVTTKPPSVAPSLDVYVPASLTDVQIKAMTARERREMAEAIYSQVINLDESRENYKEAERKMRLAVRLLPEEDYFFDQLGLMLYEQEKYGESIKSFKKALAINAQNEYAKIYLGLNYLKMRKFRDAIGVLGEVTAGNAKSFEGHLNLGLAYKGLKDYETALTFFSTAVNIKPKDAEARYEYGFCFYKTGNPALAAEQYEILIDIDEETAEKLRRDIKMKITVGAARPPKQGSYYDLK